ncbi:MAG: MFS transporter [Kocuria rhizophila]|uniref:MFS transporter n=1 Tax=Kocuria carniphila TaxID=262208 RepID=UPI000DB310BD|nr:MFS transporter [Kocuria carniphila]MCT1803843.1 MFS transporter [Kocuria carniphila]PZP30499.1 MAG: MFS transporter [Kocuria rhizophila]
MGNSPSSTLPSGTLSKRALVVASIALFVDNLVIGLAVPVLPLLPSVVEAGPAMTGILFGSYAIALIIAALLSGRLVDRVGPKIPLLIGMVGLAAATLIFAMGEPFWLLLVARFAQGVAGGMSWVAGLALIAATTSFDRRGMAMGIAISTITLGVLIGPPLAGYMVGEFGTASPFILAAGIAVLDGILRIILVRDVPRIADDTGGPMSVLRVPGSWSIVIAIMLGAAVIAALEPVLPVQLSESPFVIGLLFALAALVGVIANPVVGSMVSRVSPRILIGLGIASVVGSLLLVGWATMLWQIAIGMALLGASAALLQAPATALISIQGFRSDPPTLGGSYALYTLAYAVGLAAGPLIAGFGVEQLGFPGAMTLTAIILAAVGGLSLARLPNKAINGPQYQS